MRTYIAVYRGRTVADSKLVTVSADQGLVSLVADQLLAAVLPQDPIQRSIHRGRRSALKAIRSEALRARVPRDVLQEVRDEAEALRQGRAELLAFARKALANPDPVVPGLHALLVEANRLGLAGQEAEVAFQKAQAEREGSR